METVAQIWNEFDSIVVAPRGAGMEQRKCMRLAFYCGFHSALAVVIDLAMKADANPGLLDDENGTAVVDMFNECEDYRERAQAGVL